MCPEGLGLEQRGQTDLPSPLPPAASGASGAPSPMDEGNELATFESPAVQPFLVLFRSTPLGAEARQLTCLSAVRRVATNSSSHIGQCVFVEAIDNCILSGLLWVIHNAGNLLPASMARHLAEYVPYFNKRAVPVLRSEV